jgi:hypothetical protein
MTNPPMTDNDIAAVVSAAVLGERERCAKIADEEAAVQKQHAQKYVRSKYLYAEHTTAQKSCEIVARTIRNL